MNRSLPKTAGAMLLAAAALSSGCEHRVVLVPTGEPVQLAEPVKARIYVRTQDGQRIRSDNRVTIPEGYWALPDPGE